MSTKYPGGIISKTAPTPSGPYSTDTAPGIWTLEQQAYWQKLGQWPTAGNYNPSLFIENLFSTYLYTGTGASQTITNGIDLSTYGGLVWIKDRTQAYDGHLIDTARGGGYYLVPSSTGAQGNQTGAPTSFNSNGFTEQDQTVTSDNYASWTFRKQAKFFDVVTYTGDGTTSRSISHNLTSTPGCIIVKRTDSTGSWYVYHRGVDPTSAYAWYLLLNSTAARAGAPAVWDVPPTSTAFTVQNGTTNDSGATYVAYLFAHNAGGFGLSGSENVISCGSYTGNGSATGPVITLGYEPQWVMVKRATVSTGSWEMYDSMRGFTMEADAVLRADTSGSEFSLQRINPTSTGFQLADSDGDVNANGSTYIYIAIRRGPMAVPTLGTSVFSVDTYNQTSASDPAFNLGGVTDMGLRRLNNFSSNWTMQNRLTGNGGLVTNTTAAESTQNYGFWDNMVGWYQGNAITPPYSQANWYGWNFKRAPGFMDVVCYTGTGTSPSATPHNLTVVPEMMIVKSRSTEKWCVYHSALGATKSLFLNETSTPATSSAYWGNATPTATNFYVSDFTFTGNSGQTYVAYLFASCPGVSKVGSYTGTGTTLQVDCGFTSGARFVLIKRTDSTGDWYVWDSARGIVAGNDPYLLLNSTAAEVTGTDYVDTYSAGFEISSTAPSAINASGGTFIFLAIA